MVQIDNLPKSRSEAKRLGLTSYFTGEACENGHIDRRYTNTGICYSCKRIQAKRDYSRHAERIIETNKKSNKKNRQTRNKASREWVRKNTIKRLEILARYRNKNRNNIRKQGIQYQHRRRLNPEYRLSRAISKALWAWLKGSKAFRHWEEIVNFTVSDLREHLESKFRDGMTWENYGSYWHVDHVKPLSLCTSTEEAWTLSNLQPLTKFENLSKNNRFIG